MTYGDGQATISVTSRGFGHLYADNGAYTLTLTVRDPKGASDTVPNGAVRLWIPGGEMNFQSSSIELLVCPATGGSSGGPAR